MKKILIFSFLICSLLFCNKNTAQTKPVKLNEKSPTNQNDTLIGSGYEGSKIEQLYDALIDLSGSISEKNKFEELTQNKNEK